jgi:hypothetical protein
MTTRGKDDIVLDIRVLAARMSGAMSVWRNIPSLPETMRVKMSNFHEELTRLQDELDTRPGGILDPETEVRR